MVNLTPDVYTTLREIPRGKKVFSQIDLKHGYYQVKLDPDSRNSTGFVFNKQHYIFNRLPFGLKNAPAHFQRIIYDRIGELEFVKVFLDDILVFSNDYEEHSHHLNRLFSILKTKRVIINFEKSNFYQNKVVYLGNVVLERGVQADLSGLPQLQLTSPPKNGKELMSLKGRFN